MYSQIALLLAAGLTSLLILPLRMPGELPGTVVPRTVRSIQASLTGRLVELNVDEGSQVAPGMILGRLSPLQDLQLQRELEADLAAQKAAMDATSAALAYAQKEMLSFRRLQAMGDVSLLAVEHKESTVEQLQKQVAAQSATTQALQVRLSHITERLRNGEYLVASSHGTVITRISDQLGRLVQPGDTICEIMSDEKVIEVRVDEDCLSHVQTLERLTIRFPSHPRLSMTAKIEAIRPLVIEDALEQKPWLKNARARVVLSGPLPEDLRSGMSCEALLPWSGQECLAIRLFRFIQHRLLGS